jgi:MinD superfamily P-loop ATPase
LVIAVASGKGGTGKTTVATSLALAVSDLGLTFLDCDVEGPNAHIYLEPTLDTRQDVVNLVPEVDLGLCDGCGVCAEVCQYHAIVVLAGRPIVFPELCHGCGSCTLNCPTGAIHEEPDVLGVLEAGPAPGLNARGFQFAHGVLNVGEPMAVPVIRQLKKWPQHREDQVIIRDAPPGTSCPVVETMRGADFVLLVTEPTPFGLHDLELAVQMTRELDLPAGVIVNRDGIGDARVDEFCDRVGLPILMRIPMERTIAESLARGEPLVVTNPEYLPRLRELFARIQSLVQARGESPALHPVSTRSMGS